MTPGPTRLPTFLIAGAQKSGTTSMQRYRSDHPDAGCIGETHFFDFYFERGIVWYRQQFVRYAGRREIGEKCPEYLFHPKAIRARLATAFAEDNAALARWLGRDVEPWTSASLESHRAPITGDP